jgi:thiol-disulfide isomerase/thioredoxin
MWVLRAGVAFVCAATCLMAQGKQDKNDGPTNDKARNAYQAALELLHEGRMVAALGEFKKADKQDGGHCLACQREMIHSGTRLGDWKVAELGAEEMIADAQEPKRSSIAHYQLALVLMAEGFQKKKGEDYFARAHEELAKALALAAESHANFPEAYFEDGRALAQLRKDDEARTQFEQFVKLRPEKNLNRQRAMRYLSNPQLARARMAPPFEITTLDGRQVSMDELQGKVVLLDFWATWCQPCREALPHIQKVAKKFEGEPLVIISISVDTDQKKWKDFVLKNEMTWTQYCDGGFTGPVARSFDVHSIPHTFTIDADGVLQDEQIGDGSIDGKLKKLLTRAREMQATVTPEDAGTSVN